MQPTSPSSPRLVTRWSAIPQAWIWLFLFLASLGCQICFSRFWRPWQVTVTWHQHLGGEYFNIAQALVDGRGFSDPFGEATGPTAWMPPLYPGLLALLLFLTKSRVVVAAVILALTHASLATIGTTVYSIVRRRAQAVPPSLVVFFVLIWILAFNSWFLLITQDIWLVALAVNAMLVLIYRKVELGEAKPWAWAAVGGALLFICPALVVPWGVLVAYFALGDRQWRRWIAVVGAVVAIALPWTIRNAVTFHHFVPVKSNLPYDAYLANVIDDDGIYDDRTLMWHPYTNAVTQFEYARRGEVDFTRHYGRLLVNYLRRHRPAVLLKVMNRLIAATVYYRPMAPDERGMVLLFTRFVYALPILAFATAAGLSRRDRKLVGALALFSATYLLSYVLVAFYVRYWLALTPIFILMMFLATDALLVRLLEARSLRTARALAAVVPSP
jgi:hypothetical protein